MSTEKMCFAKPLYQKIWFGYEIVLMKEFYNPTGDGNDPDTLIEWVIHSRATNRKPKSYKRGIVIWRKRIKPTKTTHRA